MKVFAIASACWLAVSGCDGPASDWGMWPREEALGMSIAVPPHMALGFEDERISLSDLRNVRQPEWIVIFLAGEVPVALLGDNVIVSEGARPAPYVIVDRGSGSGGTEYGLSTTKLVGNKRIALFANIQTEWGVPNFANAWAVWESLRPADQAGSDVSTNRAQ